MPRRNSNVDRSRQALIEPGTLSKRDARRLAAKSRRGRSA